MLNRETEGEQSSASQQQAEDLSSYNELLESSLFTLPAPFSTENQENAFLNLTTEWAQTDFAISKSLITATPQVDSIQKSILAEACVLQFRKRNDELNIF